MLCQSFNPHSSFRPSATGLWTNRLANRRAFQSSLELSPECNEAMAEKASDPLAVSILTRAFARVQPVLGLAKAKEAKGFNPHSSFRPSATLDTRSRSYRGKVSILTRAFARVQLCTHRLRCACGNVSILTRAFARVQPAVAVASFDPRLVSILTRAFARVQLLLFVR